MTTINLILQQPWKNILYLNIKLVIFIDRFNFNNVALFLWIGSNKHTLQQQLFIIAELSQQAAAIIYSFHLHNFNFGLNNFLKYGLSMTNFNPMKRLTNTEWLIEVNSKKIHSLISREIKTSMWATERECSVEISAYPVAEQTITIFIFYLLSVIQGWDIVWNQNKYLW